MKKYKLVAACAAGLEELVAEEVGLFGGQDIVCATGVVTWSGDLEAAYRCCLWSRFSSRVFLQLAQIPVQNEESLYEGCLTVAWQEHLSEETSFAVNCTLTSESPINHSRYASLRVKDAIVDFFREKTGIRPSVSTTRPEIQIHLHIEKENGFLYIDLSGESLHRRGYRGGDGRAPLKETLGAAIVALTDWHKRGETLIDPMCGTGTLLIEAALMFGDSAPGLSRSYFGFFGWLGHDANLWSDLIAEALEREEAGLDKKWPLMVGYDCDPVVVSAARKNLEQAGLENYIQIKQAEVTTLQRPEQKGTLISNLPYGERLSEKTMVAQLYHGYGRILRQRFPGWTVGVFISNPDLTDSFSISWQSKYKLFNGSIPCRLLSGTVEPEEESFVWKLSVPDGEGGEFSNRLRKNLQKMFKWAQKEGVSCFRVYDRDLPDYNISIDIYEKWVLVHEYLPPKTVDPDIAATRLSHAVRSIKNILGVRSNRFFLKTRSRQRGSKQYEKEGSQKKMFRVREGSCAFLVNFTDYLDSGLFLDHRPVRKMISQETQGKRFLNLYGYTATASVQAALGGAASTTTVDLSTTYLDWARMNFALNGLGEVRNKVEKADCLQWLRESKNSYDYIFVDPPTFSNTKKEKRVFDIQRDHLLLIRLAMSRLEAGGKLIFSTNFRRFKLDPVLENEYAVVNISQQTIPFDFSRNKKIHMCWEIKARPKVNKWLS